MTDLQFNIYRLRKQRNLQQKVLAEALKMNLRTYVTKERGESEFKASEITAISEYFGVSYNDLFLPQQVIMNETK